MMGWEGRRVVVLGAARQGLALARYLALHGARVLLSDRKPAGDLRPAMESLDDLPEGSLEWVTGGHPFEILTSAELVCLSGGVSLSLPVVQEALKRGIPLSNDSQIFLEAAPCQVVGITGSAGKTTVTTLVGRIAEKAAELGNIHGRVWVGGNIGSPLIAVVDEMHPEDWAVMELSSFQLEIMTRSPQVAAILNITPNHLDRHSDMQAYVAAKRRILEFQAPGMDGREPAAILNREDTGSWGLVGEVRGKLWSFGLKQPGRGQPGTFVRGEDLFLDEGKQETRLMPTSSIGLRGEHNLLNVLAACAISAAAGFPIEAMRAGVEGFTGVSHRLELVRSWQGISWYNDSIATAPERTIAAIHSFEEPLVLLVGGRDKNLPWDDLADVARRRVRYLILFGESSQKIWQALYDEKLRYGAEWPYLMAHCTGLQEAVRQAAQVAEPGDVVLLSPGGTSFDEFRDFEDRGEAYKRWVMELS